MKSAIFIFLTSVALGCSNKKVQEGNATSNDSIVMNPGTNTGTMVISPTENPPERDQLNADPMAMEKPDTTGNAARIAMLQKADIQIRTFKNSDVSGFGYDIIMEGNTYVHQPNIPALPGNNGFASEALARKVAEIVVKKIRNNIMPPTIDVKELDSLGVR